MRIRPGPDKEHRDIELDETEARQARPGYNINVLVMGLAGVIFAFLVIFILFAR